MSSMSILEIIRKLERKVNRLETQSIPRWVYLSSPLTSTSWDGDGYSTTAKTLIDLSSVFGVPAGVKAVLMRIAVQDSGAAGANCWILLSGTNTPNVGWGVDTHPANDYYHRSQRVVICDSNGDIYYQTNASGANTLDVSLQVWGYYI